MLFSATDFGTFQREMQPRQVKRIVRALKQLRRRRLETLGMTPEYLGGRNCHRRIEKHLRRFRELSLADTFPQEIEQFLCPLQTKGRNDDNSAALESLGYGFKELVDGRPNDLCSRSSYVVSITTLSAWGGVAGLRSSKRPAFPRSPENNTPVEWLCSASCKKDAGRTQDMTGVDEGRFHTRGHI
jgi:hypothetical protein